MEKELTIAIIGEGDTEWFYFDSLRRGCRYPFKIAPDIAQHSDIAHICKLAEEFVWREYDHVVCLIDMDRLMERPKEMETYRRLKKKASKKILWIETNPCTEFWFLLHFLPTTCVRHYESYEQLLPELQRYMPGYEKTKRYFRRTDLYKYLSENGDVPRAMKISEEISHLAEVSPEDNIAFSQIHQVLSLLEKMAENTETEEVLKSENQNRIGTKQQEMLDFLASNADSDSKSISKAVGLKPSRTRDYLKVLLEQGLIEVHGDFRNKTYSVAKK